MTQSAYKEQQNGSPKFVTSSDGILLCNLLRTLIYVPVVSALRRKGYLAECALTLLVPTFQLLHYSTRIPYSLLA